MREQCIAMPLRYMFVANCDNLGASVNMRLLGHLASSGASMLMEVRTERATHMGVYETTGTCRGPYYKGNLLFGVKI